MLWQRRLRIVLALFIAVFAIGVFLSVRHPSPQQQPPPGVPKADPKAVVQSAKGTFLLSKGSDVDIRADYEMLFTYADGTNKLVGVVARIPERGGKDYTLKAREATVNSAQTDIILSGAVQMESNDGLKVETDSASYKKGQSVVEARGPVRFSRGRMSGSAVGMTYEQTPDVLSLLDKAVIHIAPDENGADAADIEAGLARLGRRDKYIRFEKGVKIVRGGQTTTANEATAYLSDDEKNIKMFALRGSSRVVGDKAASGGLKSMSARDIDLYYVEGAKELEHASLTSSAAIELTGDAGGASRRIAANWIDVRMAPDGATVTALVARESVQLDLPPADGAPARVVRAATLDAGGPEGKGLTNASFNGGKGQVEFRETPPAPAAPRVARSATMDLSMAGGFDTIESARFSGGVRFEESDMTALARDARYVLKTGVLTLTGVDDTTRQPPRVVDEQATIEARRIEIALEGRKIAASESVKSDLRPQKRPEPGAKPAATARAGKPGGGQEQSRLPAMLKQDQPVSAISDMLDYDGDASHAVYTGHARLWQGDTTIKGDRIVLDDRKGDLSASGNVVTNMKLEQVNDKTKAKEQVTSIATAKDMVYQDDVRRATYTTGAHLNGPQGDLRADKIELYLKENGSEVDRLEAYTAVAVTTPEGRKGTGARLSYFADDERYVMNGAPVKIIEECRETTGKTLTFFRSADRIIVDGNEQKRTETKGASACSPGPRSSD